MSTIATITTKGQVAIPKAIRDYFNLKPSDKLRFSIDGNKIVAQPAITTASVMGIIPSTRVVSKKEMKEAIMQAVLEKHANNT